MPYGLIIKKKIKQYSDACTENLALLMATCYKHQIQGGWRNVLCNMKLRHSTCVIQYGRTRHLFPADTWMHIFLLSSPRKVNNS